MFDRGEDAGEAMRRSIGVRFAEMLECGRSLGTETDDERLHALRLSGKRLRYAVERFQAALPELAAAEERLAQLTSALGDVHDCALLLEAARECGAGSTLRARIAADRERSLLRARGLWLDAFADTGAFWPLIRVTGFGRVAR
jgi:CHAD domain-containing protein